MKGKSETYVDDWINLSLESISMLKCALTGPNLNLPSRIEVVATWKDHICVVKGQDRKNPGEVHQGCANKRRVEGHGRGQEDSNLSPADTMIPDMECTSPLDLADNAVRRAREMVRRLKNVWDLLRYWQGEDEKVSLPHIQSIINVRQRRTLNIQPFRDWSSIIHVF